MDLRVYPPSEYSPKFPHFSQPHEIGTFSLDSDRNYCDDKHQLKYLTLPQKGKNLSMDLNEGYSEAIKKDVNKKEKLDSLLRWIISHQGEVESLRISFVCFRGLLTAIAGTLYERHDDWVICATRFRSVIYLCAFDTEQAIKRRENMNEREKLMCSWGYKFEQYLTSDKMNSTPNTSVPVNEREEYCTVLQGKLEDHYLLFSAEVDAEDPAFYNNPDHNPMDTNRYVELKTSRLISNERQNRNFCRYKLLKWWLQSFLAGIPKIVCGFRDDEGIVRNLSTYNVKALPKIAGQSWNASSCFQFCSHFLHYVQNCVVKDNPHIVYKFYWKPGANVTHEELKAPNEYQILPEWYIKSLVIHQKSCSSL